MQRRPEDAPPLTRRVALAMAAAAAALAVITPWWKPPRSASAPVPADCRPQPLARIPPGTPIADRAPEGWTHLIIKSLPELATGDVDELHPWAVPLSELLFTTMLARVGKRAEAPEDQFVLEKVAVGMGTTIDGTDRVISSETQEQLGAGFGPLKRFILTSGERKLDEVLQVARTDTMIVVDTPTIVADGPEHREMILRYAFLVGPEDGSLTSLVWQIDLDDAGRYARALNPAVLLAPDLVVTCPAHVDGSHVIAGIPTLRAFAAPRLPPGRKTAIPPSILRTAGRQFLGPAMVVELEAAFRRMTASMGSG